MKSVDDALAVFDESVRQAVYFYLEKDYNLKQQQIPLKPDRFDHALSNIFGERGARTIELLALKRLYAALGMRGVASGDFVEEVRRLRTRFALASSGALGGRFD